MKNEKSQNSIECKGMGIVPGIGIGDLHLVATSIPKFPRYWIENKDTQKECDRLLKAIKEGKKKIQHVRHKLGGLGSTDTFDVLDSQLLLLGDELLVKNTAHKIRSEHINAEWALHHAITEIDKSFESLGPSYIKQRQEDIRQVEEVILRELMGLRVDPEQSIPRRSIVFTQSLNPTQIVNLHRLGIAGLIVSQANEYSHAMILARAFKIPVVAATLPPLTSSKPVRAIIDGYKGMVYIKPSAEIVGRYKKIEGEIHIRERRFARDAKLPATTRDLIDIDIRANVEVIEELDTVLESGAKGIGLFRSEFLYVDRDKFPSFEEQTEVYSTLLRKMNFQPVCIRTVDAGGDKLNPKGENDFESNPALGLRAIRYSLKHKNCLEDQLKALMMASSMGQLEICLPLISTIEELRRIKKLLNEYQGWFKRKKIKVKSLIKVGVMIETPAAVLEADILAKEADFFSLGTNDLIQYTLAADRLNEDVAYLYSYYHPSILRGLRNVISAANKYGRKVTVCGEMAGETAGFALLVALGYRSFSMNPNLIPRIKIMARSVDTAELSRVVSRMFEMTSYKEIQRYWELQVKSLDLEI